MQEHLLYRLVPISVEQCWSTLQLPQSAMMLVVLDDGILETPRLARWP
jgi:hypothetical protein